MNLQDDTFKPRSRGFLIAVYSILTSGIVLICLFTYLAMNIYSESSVTTLPCSSSGSDQLLIARATDLFKRLKISGAFLISKDGKILAESFCGTSNPALKAVVARDTKFNIGSVTKQFTGYLILDLIRENKIKLDDPISIYLPEISDRPIGKVTVEQAVKMKGGIPYMLPIGKFIGVQLSNRIRSQNEMIQQISSMDLVSPPGLNFEYSNLGYNLLGAVISRIERRTWAESLKSRIFDPANMRNSVVEGETSERPQNLAQGLLPFELFSKVWFLSLPHWNYSMIKGAGGIVSTVEDLHAWNKFLTQKTQLDPSWAKDYFPKGEPAEDNYSYGWILSKNRLDANRTVVTINHGGEDPGYCAANIRLASSDTHVVLTTNSDYCAFKDGAYRVFTKAVLTYLESGSTIGFD